LFLHNLGVFAKISVYINILIYMLLSVIQYNVL